MQGVRSSPGWTRTNNPPVNSRMLCQLSYRGSAANGTRVSGEFADGRAHLGEPLLELEEVVGLRLGELSVQTALA
jgi:hypothetical protein